MATKPESNQPSSTKLQRERSPAYPFISLKIAVDRVIAFENKFGRHGSPLGKAGLAWGYKDDSSQAAQTLSALKYFGLVEYSGPTNERAVNLSEDARNYMRAQQTSIKDEIIKACALRPKAMQTYWGRWGAVRPITEICLDQLIIKDGFVDAAAKTFLRVYDETIAFAGLSDADKIDNVGGDAQWDTPPPPQPTQGSYINTQNQPNQQHAPPMRMPVTMGTKQDTFSLEEGQVVLQWPDRLSPDSYEDFESWIQLQLKKIKRSIIASTDSPIQ